MTASTLTTDIVRRRYAAAATTALSNGTTSCGCECGTDDSATVQITHGLYGEEAERLPARALEASLGCGNPTALADLHPGEDVLDLGSGGGLDVLLSAKRVSPGGMAYGLDMTDEMLELARQHQAEAGIANATFLKGRIEDVPLPDASVDVVISNCVVNLSTDKPTVLTEAFRVLRPGGRLAIADIVAVGELPPRVRESLELWAGCVAGALEVDAFAELLEDAGFTDVRIEPVRTFSLDGAREALADAGIDVDDLAPRVSGRLMSAFVRARKP
jgi:SAM-dependent methyltransferase